ncbi:hypothetical protein D8674_029138 [Pyrus ussuriensis x Pyrus communis]|uniref:Uncharacterized protein n=1 Tax=Pyrus ussuriensis x Pyrus communis TaxID=2448454 RepID=A0A5N5I2Z9_9ROSA|nr:hypothetical protein D8674_029138 [Pyrus ussuriensis x Pyrus communis]
MRPLSNSCKKNIKFKNEFQKQSKRVHLDVGLGAEAVEGRCVGGVGGDDGNIRVLMEKKKRKGRETLDTPLGHRDSAEQREKDYPKQNSKERGVTLKSKLVEDFSSNRENRDGIHVVLPGKLSRENWGWVGRTYWRQKEESSSRRGA